MSSYSSTGQFLEINLGVSAAFIRIDTRHETISIAFKDWSTWHVDTEQVAITDGLYHFIEPDGCIVGTKNFLGKLSQAREALS